MSSRTRTRTRHGAGGRITGDGGTAIIESALVAPVLFIIIVGIFEFGVIYRDWLTITDSASEAAAVGAIQGPYTLTDTDGLTFTADYTIARTLRNGLANVNVDWIDRFVVYKALPPGAGNPVDQIVGSCKTGAFGGQAGPRCNVYRPYTAFEQVQVSNANYFNCATGGATNCGWPTLSRSDGPTWADIDYLGVYVKIDRPMMTGLFGETFTVEYASVNRLEPGDIQG